jgi:hypothetical protein
MNRTWTRREQWDDGEGHFETSYIAGFGGCYFVGPDAIGCKDAPKAVQVDY